MPPLLKMEMSNGMDKEGRSGREDQKKIKQIPVFSWFWSQWVEIVPYCFVKNIYVNHIICGVQPLPEKGKICG